MVGWQNALLEIDLKMGEFRFWFTRNGGTGGLSADRDLRRENAQNVHAYKANL
jgi:hypothetical protein